ncbi:MAG: cell surface protein SprA [Bacteroidales bacterium]|nr:cell surface protein SprA [Bacteroidales bacterium]
MIHFNKYIFSSVVVLLLLILKVNDGFAVHSEDSDLKVNRPVAIFPPDSLDNDTINGDSIRYPIPEEMSVYDISTRHKLYLENPENISTEIEYDPQTNRYYFQHKVGSLQYRPPSYMTLEEYVDYDMEQSMRQHWKSRLESEAGGEDGGIIPSINIGEVGEDIFGGNTIDIRPQGTVELIFGVMSSHRADPALDEKQQRTTNFDFQEKIQMNVDAKVGDKIDFGVNYNTEATFDFDNKMKLQYEGDEDEIIKTIEAGDISMPLQNTLIRGSQSLFGVKSKLQFGKTTVTTVFSKQESETSNITVAGGAEKKEFEIKADEYEERKHYFLAQYFRDHYDEALEDLPVVNSPVNITKVEVWITNIGPATEQNRNIVALQDLGEKEPYNDNVNPNFNSDKYPDNSSNDMLTMLLDKQNLRNINNVSNYLTSPPANFNNSIDFEKVENARKLKQSEYTLNSKLGFISLNSRLDADQVLAVAYEYTVIGSDSVYQVGEFSTDGITAPKALVTKMLKSTAQNTQVPIWDLMMKNIYSLGAYQVSREDFRFNVLYQKAESGVPMGYLTEGKIEGEPLIRVLNMDNVNVNMDPTPDGVFDFIDNAASSGGTIEASKGRIYFPVVEPFGSSLRKAFDDPKIADKYAYDSLYTMTKHNARQYPDKNRFIMKGEYKSSSGSEISLNAMNVPEGSVTVTAGGVPLKENVDYTVDYTLGRVKIINEGVLNSGTPINISLESNSQFNVQTKTLIGTHVNYSLSDEANVGATIMNLTERPITQKVDYGNEPISNTLWGLNGTYQDESRLLTKWVDKLPFIETKAPSNITVDGEFAHLIPGHARGIGKVGTSYIDDFEGSASGRDIKNPGQWKLASTPQKQPQLFPEAETDSIAYGFNRAKLNWFVIDPLFVRNNNLTPDHIQNNKDLQSNHYVREIKEKEVFPNKETPNNQPTNMAVLNLAYYPDERGPYNFDVDGGKFSAGINADGSLKNPSSRWGGIMRKIDGTDFEATNIEYIEFWVMDPFIDPDGTGPQQALQDDGDLYFNLGDISEDVLKDGRKSFENGLPTSSTVTDVDTTRWGRVPTLQALTNSFDNNPSSREYQDVGLDGLSDEAERDFYQATYLDRIANTPGLGTNSQAYQNASDDPSADNYHYYRGSDYNNQKLGILERYKEFNGLEGNSATADQSPEPYPTMATTMPDVEDINQDNTLSEAERYYQYHVHLDPQGMKVGQNYITDVYEAPVTLKNDQPTQVKWYQFKIPVREPDKVVGSIQDFKSIRFMRMFMRNFNERVVLRLATLELVRSDWRKYDYSLLYPGDYVPNDQQSQTSFTVSAVNIEENGQRKPIPYVLPPEIERETNLGTTNLQKMNEQSLSVKILNLIDGDARAIYKTADMDMRRYKNLEMFIHAEKANNNQIIEDGDLTVFVRLGSDFTNNYYEYEVPLEFTPWNTSGFDEEAIWPESNRMKINLQKLVDAKQDRNVDMRQGNNNLNLNTPYITYVDGRKVTVKGTPNLAEVKTIMIGVRNPKKVSVSSDDDGQDKSAEIWVNELRLTDFQNEGGWAANVRMAADLADLGNVTVAGNMSTPGFGSIEQSITERQNEKNYRYDFATNLQLGKFFPEKTGINIPMHFDYSESFSDPEYNPLNPDVKFEDDLQTYESDHKRDSIRNLSQDYTRRKNINFMNVRKNRTGGSSDPKPWDIENFNLSYSFSEIYHRDIDVEHDLQKTYTGALGYNFSTNPKPVEPLKNVGFLKSPYLSLIRDFNFNYMPRTLSFRTNINRQYNEHLMRNKTQADIIIDTNYVKTFDWNRQYDLKYDLTKSLKIDYRADAMARVDEPTGRLDKEDSDYSAKMDTIWDNVMDLGRMNQYSHVATVNYNIPFAKLPLLNWINGNAKYKANYNWRAAPRAAEYLGNTIENSNTVQLNTSLSMNTLYNKIGYLKELNSKGRGGRGRRGMERNQRGRRPGMQNEGENKEESDKKEDEEGEDSIFRKIMDNSLKVLMGVKNVSVNYTENNGTVMPGFKDDPTILGNNFNTNAPGLGFVFGEQTDLRERAFKNGWLTTSDRLNSAYMKKHTNSLNARATIEPYQNFRIELTANRNYTNNYKTFYRADSLGNFKNYSENEQGSFSMSYFTWNTAFISDDDSDYSNENFENFRSYLLKIANRLSKNNPNSDFNQRDSLGFPDGYSMTSQDVMVPSFLAAYGGKNPDKISLDYFPDIPLPNWRLTFNGLTNIDLVGDLFKNVSINHSYSSTYTIGGYQSNTEYDETNDGFQYIRRQTGVFIPEYEINQVMITEQFSPLISFDMTMHNSLTTRIEVKKSRNLALSFSNNQLTQISSSEFVIGAGYRVKDVQFVIKTGGQSRRLSSDLNIKVDLSFRDNKTVLRKLVEDANQISAGQKVISINTSVDYKISKSINLRLFYDQVINDPYVSSQIENSNINAGISLSFTLAQ